MTDGVVHRLYEIHGSLGKLCSWIHCGHEYLIRHGSWMFDPFHSSSQRSIQQVLTSV